MRRLTDMNADILARGCRCLRRAGDVAASLRGWGERGGKGGREQDRIGGGGFVSWWGEMLLGGMRCDDEVRSDGRR